MSTPLPDGDPIADALAAQHERHREELQAINDRHAAMMNHVRTSLSYRLGDMLIELRTKQGRRRFPGRLRSIVREVRDRKRPSSAQRSDWADLEPRDELRVVSILDEFSHACLAPELHLDAVSRRNVDERIDRADLLLAETAWRGNEGDWSYAFSRFDADGPLAGALARARASSVPSALWNKEDPVNYDTFLPVARSFDYVFTTDASIVDRYRVDLGHDRIGVFMFAAQPLIHNPIGRPAEPSSTVCFAGAWRGHKYPERARQLSTLLDASSTVADLRIFDREPSRQADGEAFPERFHASIIGTLPYRQMVDEYRKHALFLNVNSVSSSPTMLSRRVFEILACRTPVVSSPAAAIDEHLSEVVPTPSGASEIAEVVGRLVHDVDHRDRVGQLGYRAVMAHHTYQHRVSDVLSTMGIGDFAPPSEPTIDIVCVSRRPEYLERALHNVRIQKYGAARLIFVTNSDEFDRNAVERAVAEFADSRVIHLPDPLTLGECLNVALDACTGEYFAKFDDDDHYGANYLSDVVLASRFADASIYGKQTFHAYMESSEQTVVRHEGHEFAETDLVMGGTLVVRRADIAGIQFTAVPAGTDTRFLKDCVSAGLRVFSTDRFNYLMTRREQVGHHTWTISDSDFLAKSRVLGPGIRLDDVLI